MAVAYLSSLLNTAVDEISMFEMITFGFYATNVGQLVSECNIAVDSTLPRICKYMYTEKMLLLSFRFDENQ